MIQRIQTLYLILVFLLSGVTTNFFNLWVFNDNISVFINDLFSEDVLILKIVPILYYVIAGLAFVTIFLFKNRQLQFVLGRLNILTNLFLLGDLIYLSLTLSGEMKVSEKGIGMFIPIVVILFLVLANKAIKKDEDLVKSVDRLR